MDCGSEQVDAARWGRPAAARCGRRSRGLRGLADARSAPRGSLRCTGSGGRGGTSRRARGGYRGRSGSRRGGGGLGARRGGRGVGCHFARRGGRGGGWHFARRGGRGGLGGLYRGGRTRAGGCPGYSFLAPAVRPRVPEPAENLRGMLIAHAYTIIAQNDHLRHPVAWERLICLVKRDFWRLTAY